MLNCILLPSPEFASNLTSELLYIDILGLTDMAQKNHKDSVYLFDYR